MIGWDFPVHFIPCKLWYCTRAAAARGVFPTHRPMELLCKISMWTLAEVAMPEAGRSSEKQSPGGIWDRAAAYRQHRMGQCNLKQQQPAVVMLNNTRFSLLVAQDQPMTKKDLFVPPSTSWTWKSYSTSMKKAGRRKISTIWWWI